MKMPKFLYLAVMLLVGTGVPIALQPTLTRPTGATPMAAGKEFESRCPKLDAGQKGNFTGRYHSRLDAVARRGGGSFPCCKSG